jgi:glyoxylase-like metal-dependent hydrolase (beta-lactamase superfamily II)
MSAPAGRLSLEVYISGHKPVPSSLPDWPDSWQATWPATTCTLISGKSDAVLVDSLLTIKESEEPAAWVRSRGKNLTAVYITHAHGDHLSDVADSTMIHIPELDASAPELSPAVAEEGFCGRFRPNAVARLLKLVPPTNEGGAC